MSDKKKVASRYDRWRGFYDLVDNFPLVSRPQKRWKREAVDRLELEGDELVLDIGTGSGEIIPWIAEKLDEGKVIGTDISQGMVGLTDKKIREASIEKKAEAVYDDIEDSDFPDDHFDRIIATFTFTTLPDPERAAEECRRILKPNGKMVVIDTGKPTSKLAMALFYPMMLSAKAFGRTHMDRDIIGILKEYFEVEVVEMYMLDMVYIVGCVGSD